MSFWYIASFLLQSSLNSHTFNLYQDLRISCSLKDNPFLFVGAAVLRIPVLYGEVEKLEESAVTVMFDKVQFSNKSANMDHWQQRFPTHVKDVATVCLQLAEKRMLVRILGRKNF